MEDLGQHSHEEHVHVWLHLDPIRVSLSPSHRPGQPVTAILTIGGSLMPAKVSIDDTAATAQITWIDDKGDTDAPRPDGAQVSFSSDNPAAVTVAPDPANPDLAHLTPVAEGSFNINVAITDASGNPLMEPDGVTPFSVPPADGQIVAGAAVGAGLAISS